MLSTNHELASMEYNFTASKHKEKWRRQQQHQQQKTKRTASAEEKSHLIVKKSIKKSCLTETKEKRGEARGYIRYTDNVPVVGASLRSMLLYMLMKTMRQQSRMGPRMAPSSPMQYIPPAIARPVRNGWPLQPQQCVSWLVCSTPPPPTTPPLQPQQCVG